MHVKALLLAGLLVVLSGCAGTQPPADVGQPSGTSSVPSADVAAAKGQGVIRGLVTNDEQLPVADAIVHVTNLQDQSASSLTLRTDPAGAYLASGLRAGNYQVQATHVSYEQTKAKRVTLAEDGEAEISFALVPLPTISARHETTPYTWSATLRFCTIPVGGCSGSFSTTNRERDIEIDEFIEGTIQTVVHEARSTEGSDMCAMGQLIRLFSPGNTEHSLDHPGAWTNSPQDGRLYDRLLVHRSGPSPAIHSPERTEANEGVPLATTGDWRFYTFFKETGQLGLPADYSCAYGRTTQVRATFFFEQPAPSDDWSAFDEGA